MSKVKSNLKVIKKYSEYITICVIQQIITNYIFC